ncbi:hypothetical protein C8Q78DRAFT_835063 [Trametes maxima]|nr:hypothetical protein C8Q78DRAFT_835063 [Trametes maxima]
MTMTLSRSFRDDFSPTFFLFFLLCFFFGVLPRRPYSMFFFNYLFALWSPPPRIGGGRGTGAVLSAHSLPFFFTTTGSRLAVRRFTFTVRSVRCAVRGRVCLFEFSVPWLILTNSHRAGCHSFPFLLSTFAFVVVVVFDGL